MPMIAKLTMICFLLGMLISHSSNAMEPNLALAKAGTNIRVVTQDGRVLRGMVAGRTDLVALWLTANAEGVSLTNRIVWSRIREIKADQRLTLPPLTVAALNPAENNPLPTNNPAITAIRSLSAFAELANFDADPEFDGLRLTILPRDANNNPVPTPGLLTIELRAQRFGRNGQRPEYVVVDRWSQEITAADYAQGGTLQLPFRTYNPRSTEYASYGNVSIRLGVPSVGTFDTIVNDVPLRNLSLTGEIR